jgi:hypothetical protein
MTTALELVSYIASLRRNLSRNQMVMAVCDGLERRLLNEAACRESLTRPDYVGEMADPMLEHSLPRGEEERQLVGGDLRLRANRR